MKYTIAFAICAALLLGGWVGYSSAPVRTVTLTDTKYVDRMVPVETVREIEVPVPGKPVVIEKIVYTDPESASFDGPVGGIEADGRVDGVDQADDNILFLAEPVDLMKGKIDAVLRKEVAQLEDGTVVGWSGEFTCSVSFGEEWVPLVTRSLSREHTTITTTLPNAGLPTRPKRWTARAGYGIGFDGEVALAAIDRRWGRVSVGVTGVISRTDAAAVATVGWSW